MNAPVTVTVIPAPGTLAVVLNRDGTSGRYRLYTDIHTGGVYYYRNRGRGAVRVYVEPGASVDWLEVSDPLTGRLAA